MKIFITGATGFIGTYLTKLLLTQGHEVTALLRTPSKRKKLPENINIIKGDLSIFEDKTLVLPAFDIVIHLAGVIFAKDDATYMRYNCTATKNIIRCIERQEWQLKRFVFASSLAAAGPSKKGSIHTEKDKLHPIDPYGKAKLAAEHFLDTVASFPTTSFRPAIVLGAGDENSLTIFKMAKNRMGMAVNGKAQDLSFVDVEDLCDAISKMILDETLGHKKYFVAHPQKISNKDLFSSLGKIMNHHVFVFPLPKFILYIAMLLSTLFSKLLGIRNQLDKKQYKQLCSHFVCSSDLLIKELDWQPQYDLYASLKKAYNGYKKAGDL